MKNSEADAKRWLRQAENDLDFSRLALREGFYAQACFMSHQVAEKALKALAYSRGDRVVRGESLMELVANLQTTYGPLSDIEQIAKLLDTHYYTSRYPNMLPGGTPSEVYHQDQAKQAVEGAEKFVDAARYVIGF